MYFIIEYLGVGFSWSPCGWLSSEFAHVLS